MNNRRVAAMLIFCLLPAASSGAAARLSPAAAHPAGEIVQRAIQAGADDPDRSRRLAEQALGLIAARPDADLEIRARLVLCEYHTEGDLAAAREQLARSSTLLSQARRGGLRAGVQSCEGEILEAAGDVAGALATYALAVSSAEAAGDDEMLANALYQHGWLRGAQGDYAAGLADLRRAVTLFEKADLPEHARTAVTGIATIYNRMGDDAQAQRFYEVALKSQLDASLRRDAAVTLYNLGRTRENLGQWAEAKKDYERALQISRQLAYSRGEAYALRGLAGVLNDAHEWQAALDRLAEVQRLSADLPDPRLQAQAALLRGVALRGLKRPAESVVSLNAALQTFSRSGELAEMATTHAALAAALADLGDWRGAYEQQRLLKAVTDRLHARQLDQRFMTLKVEFDTAARDKENTLLQREKAAAEAALEQQKLAGRLQVLVIVLASLLAVLLGVIAWRHRRTSRRMQALALIDELTHLPNRRAVLTRLHHLLGANRRCGVLIVDLDRFKSINDRYGHPVGDEVLRAVARVLADIAREPMIAGRMGGEEFLLLLPDAGLEAARQMAERVRAAIAQVDTARWFSDHGLSTSIGLTIAHPGGDGVIDALRRADEALYAAKAAGRNRVHVSPLAAVAA